MKSDKDEHMHIDRFVCSQAMMMALRGIPAIYFHSLTATENNHEGVEKLKHPRAINRKKWNSSELNSLLDDPTSVTSLVFKRLTHLLQCRSSSSAFHPDGNQKILQLGDAFFALMRRSPDRTSFVIVINNLTDKETSVNVDQLAGTGAPVEGDGKLTDLIGGLSYPDSEKKLLLKPYQVLWLT